MRYEIVLHSGPLARYASDALEGKVGKPVRVTDDFNETRVGRLVEYEVRRDGREMRVVVEDDVDLIANPLLDGGAAYSIAGAGREPRWRFADTGRRMIASKAATEVNEKEVVPPARRQS